MKIKKLYLIFVMFLFEILIFSGIFSASYLEPNAQKYNSFVYGSQESVIEFDKRMCEAGQDFMIQISPEGCSPSVVRSDLLEEQNVPVFCPLAATKLNPLIKVKAIERLDFSGINSEYVSGLAFYPAKAALGYDENINPSIISASNIGYAVIILKKQKNESSMPKFVNGTLKTEIMYDIENAYGISNARFYVPKLEDNEWEQRAVQYSFWDGKGYVKAEEVGDDYARISVYADVSPPLSLGSKKQKVSTLYLEQGKESNKIYMPNFDYCMGGFTIKLEDSVSANTMARIKVDGNLYELKEDEQFLDKKCRIEKMIKSGYVQRVSISCNQDEEGIKDFSLFIHPKVNLTIDGETKAYSVGDYLGLGENEGKDVFLYLAYAGSPISSTKEKDLEVYVAEVSDEEKDKLPDETRLDSEIIEEAAKHIESSRRDPSNDLKGIVSNLNFALGLGGRFVDWLVKENKFTNIRFQKQQEISGKKIILEGFAGAVDIELSEEEEQLYNKAIEEFDIILQSFKDEKYPEGNLISKNALIEKIKLSNKIGQKRAMVGFCEEFKEKYKNSLNELPSICNNLEAISSTGIQEETVLINQKIHDISFEGIYEPSFSEFGAIVLVKSKNGNINQYYMKKNEVVFLNRENNEYMQLEDLDEDSAKIKITVENRTLMENVKTFLIEEKRTLKKGVQEDFGSNYVFSLEKINLQKMARVFIKSDLNNAHTTANVSFKIGIEKRAIQLAPETTKKLIKSLNNSIEVFSSISKNLGKVVEVGKASCMVTGGLLVAKNFVQNVKGKGIARNRIMRGENGNSGWRKICSDFVNSETPRNGKIYKSMDECYAGEAKNIDADVNKVYEIIQSQNERIKNAESKESVLIKNAFSENIVDPNKLTEEYKKDADFNKIFENLIQLNGRNNEFGDPSNSAKSISIGKIKLAVEKGTTENRAYTLEQLKAIELYSGIMSDSEITDEIRKSAKQEMYSLLNQIDNNIANTEKLSSQSSILALIGLSNMKIQTPRLIESQKVGNYYGETATEETRKIFKDVQVGTPISVILYEGGYYLVTLETQNYETYKIQKCYNFSSYKEVSDEFLENLKKEIFPYFEKIDSLTYKNEFSKESAVVKYYESGIYKGYPSLVPFDRKNGWYAAIRETTSSFGSIQSYQDSAKVSSFWLCNIGGNRIVDFYSYNLGDDKCQLMNLYGSYAAYSSFFGLEEEEVVKLVSKAINAIADAQKQYGSKKIRIGDDYFDVGSPAVDTPEIECQDIMSAQDCKILFNLCDPFMCPSSRCDYGGKYPVKDVIQSGIIGSVFLCLPNRNEGILVPVCITGVKAGIDNLISVQENYVDCLQANLKTGETIGICDEIHSFYLCDLIWREAIPILKMGVPKILGIALGQNVHGGGEYLSISNAWETIGQSISYFTQNYADDSYKAFKLRSTEDLGTGFCNLYTSITVPSSGDIFGNLIEPDSPIQFSGRFQEISLTTASLHPMSQYKVYYHIYAGNDAAGAYYQVYLKSSTGGSYYQDIYTRRIVDSGYINKGNSKSETKDFSAISGYDTMCIRVNDQEECGFQQVSTSFASELVEQQYLNQQVSNTKITKESECVSGSINLLAGLNDVNLQAGLEETFDPAIYERGITRICATDDPGKGTDNFAGTEGSRWKIVGYCGDSSIKCWLDMQSVKEVLNGLTDINKTFGNIEKSQLDVLNSEYGFLGEEEFKLKVEQINDDSKTDDEKLSLIEQIFSKIYMNNHKAYLHYLKGLIYAKKAKLADPNPMASLEKNEIIIWQLPDNFVSPVFDVSGIFKDIKSFQYKDKKWVITTNSNFQFDLNDINKEEDDSSKTPNDLILMTKVHQLAEREFLKEIYNEINKPSLLNLHIYNIVLEEIIAKTKGIFNKILLTADIKFSYDGVFEVKNNKDLIYFNFLNDKWYVGKKVGEKYEWQQIIEDTGRITGISLSEKNKELVRLLVGNTFNDGARLILNGGEYREKTIQKIQLGELKKEEEEIEKKEIPFVTNEVQKKVLTACSNLNGKNANDVKDLDNSGGDINCHDSVLYIYNQAGLDSLRDKKCVYSDEIGKQYIVNGMNIPKTANKNNAVLQINPELCKAQGGTVGKDINDNEQSKLDLLQPGYILSIYWGYSTNKKSHQSHNVIFIKWIDRDKNIAQVFDWGPSHEKERIFGYGELNLSDNLHPVYMVWKPVFDLSNSVVITDIYERYKSFESLFRKYSIENTPAQWKDYEFEALLVAIAQKETNLGLGPKRTELECGKSSNENCSYWLMGYTGKDFRDGYKGTENQIKFASGTLKSALNGPSSGTYSVCNEHKNYERRIKCILSVYNTGKDYTTIIVTLLNEAGKSYADEVYGFWESWKNKIRASIGIEASS